MTQHSAPGPYDPHHWLSYVPASFAHRSPLYAHLYQQLTQDPELFALLRLIDPDQPIPVLFFSVVMFVLLGEEQDALAQFYPYLTPAPKPPQDAYPAFRAFCLAHWEELQTLLPVSRLQTNEVRRCANLLPAFEIVFQRGERRPLALIEVGSSAGLNLNWHRFGYHYGEIVVGDLHSPVQIHCIVDGKMPPLPEKLPRLAQCHGIEAFPLDIASERDVRWLRSCIWPEEAERYQLLDAALAVARQYSPQILPGDACKRLPGALATIPYEQTVCVFHSFALNQGPDQVRAQVIQTLLEESQQRPVYRVSLEATPLEPGCPRLELFTYHQGACIRAEVLAECEFHGERMQWLHERV